MMNDGFRGGFGTMWGEKCQNGVNCGENVWWFGEKTLFLHAKICKFGVVASVHCTINALSYVY